MTREGSLAHQEMANGAAINEDKPTQVSTWELVPQTGLGNHSTQEEIDTSGGGKRRRSVEQENSSDLNETELQSRYEQELKSGEDYIRALKEKLKKCERNLSQVKAKMKRLILLRRKFEHLINITEVQSKRSLSSLKEV